MTVDARDARADNDGSVTDVQDAPFPPARAVEVFPASSQAGLQSFRTRRLPSIKDFYFGSGR